MRFYVTLAAILAASTPALAQDMPEFPCPAMGLDLQAATLGNEIAADTLAVKQVPFGELKAHQGEICSILKRSVTLAERHLATASVCADLPNAGAWIAELGRAVDRSKRDVAKAECPR